MGKRKVQGRNPVPEIHHAPCSCRWRVPVFVRRPISMGRSSACKLYGPSDAARSPLLSSSAPHLSKTASSPFAPSFSLLMIPTGRIGKEIFTRRKGLQEEASKSAWARPICSPITSHLRLRGLHRILCSPMQLPYSVPPVSGRS